MRGDISPEMDSLRRLALDARRFLEPHWADWHATWGPPPPTCLSEWTCVRSSIFLQRVLHCSGLEADLVSGVPDQTGSEPVGFHGGRRWHSHAWVRTRELIVDITADQFGAEEVLITSWRDIRYVEGLTIVNTLRPTERHAAAVDAIWPAWASSRV